MKQELSTTEIASYLGITDRNVAKIANKEGWISAGENGGKRYLLGTMPESRQLELVSIINRRESISIHEKQKDKALIKADLLRHYSSFLTQSKWGGKVQARDSFIEAYNSGILLPHIFKTLGKLSWKTIESWKTNVKNGNGDTLKLADNRGYVRKNKSKLSDIEKEVFLRCLLHPNKPLISEAYRTCQKIFQVKGINIASAHTFRRFLEKWISTNYEVWIFIREGAKAWNDKVAYYIERNYDAIGVGDIIVADGHRLNFEIQNPFNAGIAKRMALILWFDMKSSFPLGWEIMPEENTQSISSALRRAIITLGKLPRIAYLDNGRAFKSKFFTNTDLTQAGFAGLYERLGIDTIFAWAYHGQSKTIERFFGTFAELERLAPSYSGTSIEHKPPRLHRGEKLHRQIFDKFFPGKAITMEQAHEAIANWFAEYANREQRGHLKGKTPFEVFKQGKGKGIDKLDLTYLMMSAEVKTIHRNGITFRKQSYYAPELYGRKHACLIRYDLQDPSFILVFDKDGQFICTAHPVTKIHPAARLMGTQEEQKLLEEHIKHKKSQEKDASRTMRDMLKNEVLPSYQKQLENAGISIEQGKIKQIEEVKIDENKIASDIKKLEEEQEETSSEIIKYKECLEKEAQGDISSELSSFMSYFETTSEYAENKDELEDYRIFLLTREE